MRRRRKRRQGRGKGGGGGGGGVGGKERKVIERMREKVDEKENGYRRDGENGGKGRLEGGVEER